MPFQILWCCCVSESPAVCVWQHPTGDLWWEGLRQDPGHQLTGGRASGTGRTRQCTGKAEADVHILAVSWHPSPDACWYLPAICQSIHLLVWSSVFFFVCVCVWFLIKALPGNGINLFVCKIILIQPGVFWFGCWWEQHYPEHLKMWLLYFFIFFKYFFIFLFY